MDMKLFLFVELFFLYRRFHGVKYSYTRAKEIAFSSYPF